MYLLLEELQQGYGLVRIMDENTHMLAIAKSSIAPYKQHSTLCTPIHYKAITQSPTHSKLWQNQPMIDLGTAIE